MQDLPSRPECWDQFILSERLEEHAFGRTSSPASDALAKDCGHRASAEVQNAPHCGRGLAPICSQSSDNTMAKASMHSFLQPIAELICKIRDPVRALLLCIGALQLFACASEPNHSVAQAEVPPLPAGSARVWVLRQFEPGLGVQWTPMTYINGAPLAPSYAGTAFYRDLGPGTYTFTVESCTTDFNQSQTLRLTPGTQADLEVQVLNSIPAWGCYDPNTFYIRQIPPQRAQLYFNQVRYVGPG